MIFGRIRESLLPGYMVFQLCIIIIIITHVVQPRYTARQTSVVSHNA